MASNAEQVTRGQKVKGFFKKLSTLAVLLLVAGGFIFLAMHEPNQGKGPDSGTSASKSDSSSDSSNSITTGDDQGQNMTPAEIKHRVACIAHNLGPNCALPDENPYNVEDHTYDYGQPDFVGRSAPVTCAPKYRFC